MKQSMEDVRNDKLGIYSVIKCQNFNLFSIVFISKYSDTKCAMQTQ